MPSLTCQFSVMELIFVHECFQAIRPVEIPGHPTITSNKSYHFLFAVRLLFGFDLSRDVLRTLGSLSHCFNCSEANNSPVEQVKNWYELEHFGTYNFANPPHKKKL